MHAYLALVCGIVFVVYGASLLVGDAEPSWFVAGILPGGLVLLGVGLLGVLIPGYL